MITNRRETGFTLIELMASLLIASILLLAMYQNFVVSQRSHQLLEGYSLLQENARFSEIVLARSIRTAGYRTNPFITMDGVFPASGTAATPTVSTFPAAGQIISGVNNNGAADVVLDGTDTVSFRFQGNADGSSTDCLGNAVGAGVMAVNTFYVRTDNSLHCSSNIGGSDQPLANGVEDMQILYGIDTSDSLVAGRYVNAGAVTAAQWPDVVSVRVAVLYTTVTRIPDTAAQSFPMLDNGTAPFDDGLRRQLFTTTLNLRNRSF